MNKWVAFDMDEVLANIREPMCEAINKETGSNIHWKEWKTYNLAEVYEKEIDLKDVLTRHQVIENATMEPFARDAIAHAKGLGYRVAIVTARGWHDFAREITIDWLEQRDIEVDRVEIVPHKGSKCETLKKIGPVKYFIDDHVDHIINAKASKSARINILRDRPWNRANSSEIRVHSLKEILSILK